MKRLEESPQPSGNAWRSWLDRAAAKAGETETAALFHEERHDFRVTWDPGRRITAVDSSRSSGLAVVRHGGDQTFVADPVPPDLDEIEPVSSLPDLTPTLAWIDRFAAEADRRAPDARIELAASGFDQRVTLALASSRAVEDRRRGLRFRAAIRLDRRGRIGSAALDVVVRADRAPEEDRIPGLVRTLVERATVRLDAGPAPRGPSEVVFGPGAGGVLAHEIVGHALEADVFREGSWLTAAAGPVASPGLTIVDDPRRSRAPWKIDDEGQEARVAPLIREGRVVGWLHDRATAAREGATPTGHGRRATFRDPIRPRMGCTFIAAGTLDPEEVLAPVARGLYVRRIEAGSIDVVSGRATFRVTDADIIAKGRIDRPAEPCLLDVNASAVLMSIDRIGYDVAFDTTVGSCHRDGQTLAISVGAPTIWSGLGCNLY